VLRGSRSVFEPRQGSPLFSSAIYYRVLVGFRAVCITIKLMIIDKNKDTFTTLGGTHITKRVDDVTTHYKRLISRIAVVIAAICAYGSEISRNLASEYSH